ncbi:MAG: hypothetical protein V1770_05860 [bacterium]
MHFSLSKVAIDTKLKITVLKNEEGQLSISFWHGEELDKEALQKTFDNTGWKDKVVVFQHYDLAKEHTETEIALVVKGLMELGNDDIGFMIAHLCTAALHIGIELGKIFVKLNSPL